MKTWLTPLAAALRRPRWMIVLAGLCLAAAWGGWCIWKVWQIDDLRRQALAAMDDRDFETAQARLKAYAAARSKDGEARFLLAQAHRRARVELLDQAHDDLYQARHLGYTGEDVDLESALLDVQENGPSPQRAAVLQRCLDGGGSKEALALEALARGCIAQNRLADANAWLNRWIGRAPDDWYPRLWRGAIFEYMNEAGPALADFEFARQKRPQDEEIRMRVGLMLARSGLDCSTALQYLEPYSQTHPEDVDVVVALARCHRVLQQPAEAEALLRPVVAAHPDNVDALLTLALVESDHGDDAGALEQLRRLDPLVRQSRPPSLLPRLRRAAPVLNHVDMPERKRVVFGLFVTILGRMERTEEAKKYLAEVDRLDAMMKELDQCSKQFQQNPQDVAALDKVGTLYLQVGMPEEGAAVLERVLKMKPDDLAAHRALAEYYESSDDPEMRRQADQHRRFVEAAPPSSNLQGP
ncbi:MAG TPA: tetratricopeptide repeat protein [Gemmataceae bacterium]|nr:tetratricopeptide repeat protein [Gemmataceae bacterium]